MKKRPERANKARFTIYVDPTAIRIIRAYSKETDQSIHDILSEMLSMVDIAIMNKAVEINKIRRESLLDSTKNENFKEENAQRLEELVGQYY